MSFILDRQESLLWRFRYHAFRVWQSESQLLAKDQEKDRDRRPGCGSESTARDSLRISRITVNLVMAHEQDASMSLSVQIVVSFMNLVIVGQTMKLYESCSYTWIKVFRWTIFTTSKPEIKSLNGSKPRDYENENVNKIILMFLKKFISPKSFSRSKPYAPNDNFPSKMSPHKCLFDFRVFFLFFERSIEQCNISSRAIQT